MTESKGPKRAETITELRRHDFTDNEVAKLAESAARLNRDVIALKDGLKSQVTLFKANIAQKEAEFNEMMSKISSGHEMRPAKLKVLYDHPEPGKKAIVDQETCEIVREEEMATWENQGELPLGDPDEATAGEYVEAAEEDEASEDAEGPEEAAAEDGEADGMPWEE